MSMRGRLKTQDPAHRRGLRIRLGTGWGWRAKASSPSVPHTVGAQRRSRLAPGSSPLDGRAWLCSDSKTARGARPTRNGAVGTDDVALRGPERAPNQGEWSKGGPNGPRHVLNSSLYGLRCAVSAAFRYLSCIGGPYKSPYPRCIVSFLPYMHPPIRGWPTIVMVAHQMDTFGTILVPSTI